MSDRTMFDAVYEWQQQNNATRTEGSTGVKNLCRLVRVIGYRDPMHNGQFAHDGAYGDLTTFLEDNPGAIEAITDWITSQDQCAEWLENLEAELPEIATEDCKDCGADEGEPHNSNCEKVDTE